MASSDYSISWNASSVDEEEGHTLTWYIIVGIIYGSIILVTIVGNLLVILAFKRDRRINTKIANWYIVNLSVADLTVGLISLTINLIWLFDPEGWPFGEIPCKIYLFIDYVVTNVPVVTIIFISLDRYWLLTKKLEYPKYATKTKATVFIIFMWTFCITFFGVLTFAWIPITGFQEEIEYDWNCELEATYNFECQLFMIALFFFVPLLTIACFNFVVYRNIRERSKGFVQSKPVALATKKPAASTSNANAKPNDTDGSNTGLGKGTSDISLISLSVQNNIAKGTAVKTAKPADNKQKEFNRHRKAAITLAVLVGVFVVCLLPFYIASLLGTLCEECVGDLAWEITSNLFWCNSTINPFLYAAMNLYFRQNFVKFLGLDKCIFKKRTEPVTSFTDG
ncbi:5-hydroxytryptamine receptor 1D-like [Amphiura filiformis]|uniref:5-hydroxytryptamine receptor 1D-like n=1 Tax=Amphiura filiformis TaxID=82378 RepID=UPI003B2222CD